MADNIKVPPSTVPGDPPVKTRQDTAGAHWQQILVCFGAKDSESVVSSGSPFPVSAATLPLPTGAATNATLIEVRDKLPTLVNSRIPVEIGNASAIAVSVSGVATETTLAAVRDRLPTLVSGRLPIEVGNASAIPVSVSGVATNATVQEIRDRLPGSLSAGGRVVADVVGSVSVGNTVTVTGALTDTQLRASSVPVSGPLTNAELRNSAVPISLATLPTLASGTNRVGLVDANATDLVSVGGSLLTPKFATISASSSGNNTLVAAVSGKKIRVISFVLNSSGTVNCKLQSGAGGTDLTGLFYFVANTGLVLPYSACGWLETASGGLLNLNLSAGVQVGGIVVYVEV